MKKLSLFFSLLFSAAALQAAPIDFLASAQTTPLKDIQSINPPASAVSGPRRAHKTYVTPEGTPLDYTIQYTQGATTYPDIPVKVSFSEDGQSVYISNLFPGFLKDEMGAWTKGDIQPDSTIIIKLQPIIDYDVYGDESMFYTLYAGSYDLTAGVMGDVVFVLNADGSITQQDPDVYVWLGAYINGAYGGLISYGTNVKLAPQTAVYELVTVPETAVVADGIYEYTDAYNKKVVELGKVATDGDDVYFLGLVPQAGTWVKGTRDGNTVTIKKGQYLGDASGYMLELAFLQARADFSSYEFVDEITLAYDPETGIYTQPRESETDDHFMIVEQTVSGKIYLYNFDFTIKPYDGPKASIPEDPFDLKFYDFWESQQKYALMFSNSHFGTDGNYLDPANRYYYIYLDDEILTFDKETYPTLSEEITLVPWDLTLLNSEGNNYEIYGSPTSHYAYIYDPLFEKVGVQFIYFFEDQPYYSNIVYIDPEGNVTTVEVEQPNAITNAGEAKVTGMEYFNVAGQRQNFQQPGLNLVRVTLSDGTQKTYKMYVK
ncbi:MAG: hypothetical protein IKX59_09015 [Bacteroidales bacterium]|nr:hypothetical protein [Bacteroidales bacterium]